jgi:hypothetical protein
MLLLISCPPYEVQATEEAFIQQKRTFSTSKHKTSSLFLFLGHFCPPGSGSGSIRQKSMQIQICNTIYKIFSSFFTLNVSVADPDPGSGIGCLFDPWILDPGSGMGESQHPDPGSGMNNPDHIF